MSISIRKIIMALFILSAFAQPAIAFTTTAIGSILVFTISMIGGVYSLRYNVSLNKGLLLVLLMTITYAMFLCFIHKTNPFSLGFLSLIYVSIFLAMLLKKCSVEQRYQWLMKLYTIHICYILFECLLLFLNATTLLDMVSNHTFRHDYNQLQAYFSWGAVTISSQSLFLKPNASGILIVLFTFLVLLSPKVKVLGKTFIVIILLPIFVLFALNGSAVVVAVCLIFGFLSLSFIGKSYFFKGNMRPHELLTKPFFLALLILLCVGLYVFMKQKIDYHPRLSTDELHQVTENIYLNSYRIWRSQSTLNQLFGVGVGEGNRLAEYGDCLVGNIVLKFGIVLFIFPILFVIQLLQLVICSLLQLRHDKSEEGQFIAYLLTSNFLLFIGWLLTTVHYGVLVMIPGLTLAAFSAAIVIATASERQNLKTSQIFLRSNRFAQRTQGAC
jgi:hypothetical protein